MLSCLKNLFKKEKETIDVAYANSHNIWIGLHHDEFRPHEI